MTMSVFGAIVMYLMSMAALFRLRASEPGLTRPFLAPGYPWSPATALVLAAGCLVAMIYFNPAIAVLFAVLLASGCAGFLVFGPGRATGSTPVT
ncbi:MAG TPA: hypothetical protein VMF13_05090 [Luteitalea sp.]|nr:hypothetical protein [Luteitalea sp.]